MTTNDENDELENWQAENDAGAELQTPLDGMLKARGFYRP